MLRHLQTLYGVGTLTGLTDRELLERFQSANQRGDYAGADLVLSALIERHAAMVWGVCRALIRDPHDAEDAFQATFLILVRKAGSLRIRQTLSSWLYVVAYRTGLSIRSAAARQRTIERAAASLRREATDRPGPAEREDLDNDVLAIIHSEIMRLPGPSRAVVVLCDLEGLGYREAARRLNLPLGTVQSRLARARARLRKSLIRQGIPMPASSESGDSPLGSMLGVFTGAELPQSLARRISRLCVTVASDPACTGPVLTSSVQSLINGGLRAMFFGNLKRALSSLVGGVLVCGALWHPVARSGQPGQEERPSPSRPDPHQASEDGPIRKKPEIPAPRQVKVSAGQGKILMFVLNKDGERIREKFKRNNRIDSAFKEGERDVRWAVVTGILDHRRVQWWFRDGGRHTLKSARETYLRVDLERKSLQKDGSWSEWQPVDMPANLDILDNIPEADEERTPEDVRLGQLVDPLPHLTSGKWKGVDVEHFVPIQQKPAENPPIGLREARDQSLRANTPPAAESPVLMLRTLDFTVEAGRTYRYRSRVVVRNPDYQPGEKQSKVKRGPWSEATEIVTVP